MRVSLGRLGNTPALVDGQCVESSARAIHIDAGGPLDSQPYELVDLRLFAKDGANRHFQDLKCHFIELRCHFNRVHNVF
jgi:hypothetical protein